MGDFDRVAFFEATPNWKASELAKHFDGFLGDARQGDGYAGFDKFASRKPGLIEASCLDHARRKVYDSYLLKDPRVAWLLEQFGRI